MAVLHVESGKIGVNNENPQASFDVSGSTLFSERPTVNGTGVMLSGDINITNFYTNDNPSGFITGIENLVYTTGDQAISGRKQFSEGLDAGLQVGISTLYVGSGLVGVNNEDPQAAFDVSGSVLFSQRPTVNGTGVLLSGDIDSSGFYPNNNPSGFITGIKNLVYTTGDQNISGIKTFANDVTILGNFAVSGTTFINEVIDVTTTGIISGVTGVFQYLEADNIVYSQTNAYVVAQAGDDLIAKYAEAAALTPNGSAKSATNRASLIVFPGEYATIGEPVFDEEFVDVIALGSSEKKPSVFIEDGSIHVTANDVRVVGISTKGHPFDISGGPLQVFENCSGGNNSFGYSDGSSAIYLEGIYINCSAGNNSFCHMVGGNDAGISGTLTNCSAGDNSFGYTGGGGTLEVSGNFEKCSGNNNCFNSDFGINSIGTYKDCSAGINSFTAGSSIHIRCTAGNNSFGTILVEGIYKDCTAGDFSFGASSSPVTITGTFENCTAGTGSFGNSTDVVTINVATFKNCHGALGCFGNSDANVDIIGNTSFENCTAGNSSFGSSNSSTASIIGIFLGCSAGNNSFGCGYATNIQNSIFKNCVSENNSFGWGEGVYIINSTFDNCSAVDESFIKCFSGGGSIDSSSLFNSCTARNRSFGNSPTALTVAGTFKNCKGGSDSFGVDMEFVVITGKIINCEANSFPSVVYDSGLIFNCIDGNGDVINAEA